MCFYGILWVKFLCFTPIPRSVYRSSSCAKSPVWLLIFRNEKENVPQLKKQFKEIYTWDLPLEMYLVNDHSTDGSEKELDDFLKSFADRIKLVHAPHGVNGKKQILSWMGKQFSDRALIVSDADCLWSKPWYQQCLHYQGAMGMVLGPLVIHGNKGMCLRFQRQEQVLLNRMIQRGAERGKGLMASAANMMLLPPVPWPDWGTTVSGDDHFLMESYVSKGLPLHFMHQPVATKAPENWQAYLHQRSRWASKIGHMKLNTVRRWGSLVLFSNLLYFFGLGLGCFWPTAWLFLGMKWMLESAVNLYLRERQAQDTQWLDALIYPLMQPWIHLAVAIHAVKKKQSWKGRSYSVNGS